MCCPDSSGRVSSHFVGGGAEHCRRAAWPILIRGRGVGADIWGQSEGEEFLVSCSSGEPVDVCSLVIGVPAAALGRLIGGYL